jgi:hypothetical protein
MATRSKRKREDHPSAELPASDGLMVLLRVALIIGAGLWVYSPVFHGDWLWDDDWYITRNPLLNTSAGLWELWFRPGSWVEYYPIHETLIWIEWQLFGNDPYGYHLVSIALHLVDSLLVWRLLTKLGLRKAWLGGLIFAVHPACVDSVAWIAETKNTLSLLPFLLAMSAWIDFDHSTSPRDYVWALALFTLSMLCKITAAPFPAIILLYAWWKRSRIGTHDLLRMLPFALVSVVLSLTTIACDAWYYTNHDRLAQVIPLGGVLQRTALIGQTLSVYFTHCFWPVGLLPIYPQWHVDGSSLLSFLPWPIFAGVLFLLWRKRSGWGRHALFGLAFFTLFLLPFLGFLSVSYMSSTWIMDHFLYVPLIALIALVVAAIDGLERQIPPARRVGATGAVTVLVALLAFEAHAYTTVYTDETSLWSYTLDHYPDSWLGHYNLGNALFLGGDIPAATAEYRLALENNPNSVMAHNNLGIALAQQNQLAEARVQFEAAQKLAPHLASPRNNLEKLRSLQAPAPAR